MKPVQAVAAFLLLAAGATLVLNPVASSPGEAVTSRVATGEAVEEVLRDLDILSGSGAADIPSEVLQRPIFFKTRRPPVEPGPEPPSNKDKTRPKPDPVTPLRLALKGIVGVGADRYALVLVRGEKQTRRLRVGETIDGWTLRMIGADRLVLTQGRELREILLWTYQPHVPPRKPPANAGRKVAGKPAPKTRSVPAGQAVPERRQRQAVSRKP